MKKTQKEAEKTIMRILIVCILACCIAGAEDSPGFTALGGGQGPIVLNPDGIDNTMRNLFGEEAAVQDGHYLFLNGNYTNGSWVLGNMTVA
jgi:hypothetical protein